MYKSIKKIIVFDADGVLFPGGENLKDAAWDTMMESHSCPTHTTSELWVDAIKTARAVFGAGQGTGSRYDIIALALTATGRLATATDTVVAIWAETYNQTVQGMIQRRGIYPETKAALLLLQSTGHHLYVNTATPTNAVIESLVALNLTSFFTEVYGQPATKIENLEVIARREEVAVHSLIFVGDGSGDVRAAASVNCTFIGVRNDSNQWNDTTFPLIDTLMELPALL